MDVLKLKIDADSQFFQMPRAFKDSLGITGKPGDRFGDDEFETPLFCIFHHMLESRPVLFETGDAVVVIYLHKLIPRVRVNDSVIVCDLILQRIFLPLRFRGNATVYGDGDYILTLVNPGNNVHLLHSSTKSGSFIALRLASNASFCSGSR